MKNHSGPTEKHYTHLTIGVFQNFGGLIIALATGLVTAGVLSRELGPSDYGLLGLTVSIVLLVELTISAGFKRSTEKLVATRKDWQSIAAGAIQAQLVVALAATVLLLICSPLLADLLKTDRLTFYLRVYAISLPFSTGAALLRSVLSGQGKFKAGAVLVALYWLLRLVIVLAAVKVELTVTSVLMANSISSAAILLIAKKLSGAVVLKRTRIPINYFAGFAWPLSLLVIATTFLNSIDLLFVKRFVSNPDITGFYSAARNIALIPGMFAGAAAPLLLSKLSIISAEGHLQAFKTLMKETLRITVCLLPVFSLAAGAAGELMGLVYGDRFQQAGPVFKYLIIGAFSGCLQIIVTFLLISLGRNKTPLLITLPFVPLAVSGYFLIVPSTQAIGAAAFNCAVSWILSLTLVASFKRLKEVMPSPWTFCRAVLIAIIVYFSARLWPAPGLLLPVKLIFLTLMIPALYILTGELSWSQLQIMVRTTLEGLSQHTTPERQQTMKTNSANCPGRSISVTIDKPSEASTVRRYLPRSRNSFPS